MKKLRYQALVVVASTLMWAPGGCDSDEPSISDLVRDYCELRRECDIAEFYSQFDALNDCIDVERAVYTIRIVTQSQEFEGTCEAAIVDLLECKVTLSCAEVNDPALDCTAEDNVFDDRCSI